MKKSKLLLSLSTTLIATPAILLPTSCNNKSAQRTIAFACSEGITLEGELSIVVNNNTKWKDVTKPKVITPSGYSEFGWYNTETYEFLEDETIVNSDLKTKFVGCDPQQTFINVTVNIDGKSTANLFLQGGTWGQYRKIYNVPDTPSKEGYRFKGWYVNDNQIADSYVFPSTQYVVVNAVFEEVPATITFTASEGVTLTGETTVEVRLNTTWKDVNKPTVDVTSGYSGKGWFCGYEAMTDDTVITHDMTIRYVALPTGTEVTVKVDPDRSQSEYYTVKFIRGLTWANFREYYDFTFPKKEGYKWLGWYDTDDETQTLIADDWIFPTDKDTVSIKAKYEQIKPNLHFTCTEGVQLIGKTTVEVPYGTKWGDLIAGEIPEVKVLDGYKGLGWYHGPVAITKDTVINEPTFEAKYVAFNMEEAKVDVTIDIDGKVSTLPFLQGYSFGDFRRFYNIPSEPTKEGYRFETWLHDGKQWADMDVFPIGQTEFSVEAEFHAYFETDTWENLGRLADQGIVTLQAYYHIDNFVGRSRKLRINGQDHKVTVVGQQHDALSNAGYIEKKAALSFQCMNLVSDSTGKSMETAFDGEGCYDITDTIFMHNLNGGNKKSWQTSVHDMIKESEPGLYQALKTVDKVRYDIDKTTDEYLGLVTYSTVLFPITLIEMNANEKMHLPEQGKTYEYWKERTSSKSRILRDVKGNPNVYWVGTPDLTKKRMRPFAADILEVDKYGTVDNTEASCKWWGVSFGFCI